MANPSPEQKAEFYPWVIVDASLGDLLTDFSLGEKTIRDAARTVGVTDDMPPIPIFFCNKQMFDEFHPTVYKDEELYPAHTYHWGTFHHEARSPIFHSLTSGDPSLNQNSPFITINVPRVIEYYLDPYLDHDAQRASLRFMDDSYMSITRRSCANTILDVVGHELRHYQQHASQEINMQKRQKARRNLASGLSTAGVGFIALASSPILELAIDDFPLVKSMLLSAVIVGYGIGSANRASKKFYRYDTLIERDADESEYEVARSVGGLCSIGFRDDLLAKLYPET